MPFVDPIGECDECGQTAFFDDDEEMYCTRHSAYLNDVTPETVEEVAREVRRVTDVSKVAIQPMGFIGATTTIGKIPWKVCARADRLDYRVSGRELIERGQFVLEPKDANVSYEEVEEFLD